MQYSKAIRIARSLADLTQSELAKKVKVNAAYISLIESGKRQPTIEMVEKIARALKLPFHLLALLASEKTDRQNINAEQLTILSLALIKLVLESN